MTPHYITGGGLRVDTLITQSGEANIGLIGGNALYAAVGAALWTDGVGVWARVGANYPLDWLARLTHWGLDHSAIIRLAGSHDHRTFYAYTPTGQRDDTHPAGHFARIGQPLPDFLRDYVHSTPGQDDPQVYEPLALRAADWPQTLTAVAAVHLSPLSICSHRDLPPFLRSQNVPQITVDPGERYMTPALADHIRHFLPHISAFLPSDQEIRSLFGDSTPLEDAARTLGEWGAPLVIIKRGADGVLLYERDPARLTTVPAFHAARDRRVVDVTGAGDAFCGGFMIGLRQTGDPLRAVHYGLVSASLVIEGYGALYALSRGPKVAHERLATITL